MILDYTKKGLKIVKKKSKSYLGSELSEANNEPTLLKSMRKVCGDYTTDIINKWYSKRKCSELYKCYLHNIFDLNLKFKVKLKIINHSMLCYRFKLK